MDFVSLAIILTGGWTVNSSTSNQVEVLNADGSYFCNLPTLPNPLHGISQIDLLACGGFPNTTSCSVFNSGKKPQFVLIVKLRL